MASGFISRVFGRSSPFSPEVETALAELANLAQQKPTLAKAAALLGDLLPKVYDKPAGDRAPQIGAEHASAKLSAGLPLLRGEDITIDIRSFHQRWLSICLVEQQYQQDEEAGKRLARAVRRGHLDIRELIRELLAGSPRAIHAWALALELDAGLVASTFRLALFPALAQFNAELLPLRQGRRWEQGFCPTCGSWPLLGEFRGLEQTRFLRCGLCASEWQFPRLVCSFCGTREHDQLGYFHLEGEESKCRAATCNRCRGYVKMLATLTPITPPQLLVADLATIHLDLAAAERCYVVPQGE